MKCPKCGKEIANDSQFCEYCGTRIFEKKNYKKLWPFLVLLIGIVLAVLGILAINSAKNESSEIVSEPETVIIAESEIEAETSPSLIDTTTDSETGASVLAPTPATETSAIAPPIAE